ncbi:MAG: trigger factor [Bacilli bacterium]|nr:trigger factor [Bacilli bacterium]
MKLNVTKTSEAITTIKAEFDSQEWNEAQEKAYAKLAKDVEVKGFRKGEAPLKIAKQHIKPQDAMSAALEIIIPTGFKEIDKVQKFTKLLVNPNVNVDEISADRLVISYVFTERPSVKLGTYKGIKLEKHPVEVKDEEIEQQLKQYAEQMAVLSDKDKEAVTKGDIVNFDFEGYTDGKAFEGGKAENYELEIGSNKFIPGFEEQLIGKKIGERCDIDVTFPTNYVKELAGKKATFKILIHSIKEKQIPAIDDELAKDAQIENVNTLKELKEHIKKTLVERKTQESIRIEFNVLVDQIVAQATLVVPTTLIASDTEYGYRQYVQNVESKGIPFDKYCEVSGQTPEKIKADIQKDVEKNLKTVFVLTEIAKDNNIKVEPKDIDNEIKGMADHYKVSEEEIRKAFEKRMPEITNKVFSDKISEYLKSVNTLD